MNIYIYISIYIYKTYIYIYIYIYIIYIYTYIHIHVRTNIMDFRGFDSSGSGSGPGRVTRCLGPRADSGIIFDSSIILIQRGGIFMSLGDFPESLSRAMLVGIMLVEILGVMR